MPKWPPEPGGVFICIDLDLVATKTGQLLSPDEYSAVVGVGASGTAFARRIEPRAPGIEVVTTQFSAAREERQLSVNAPDFTGKLILVDDVMVSGRTLEVVTKSIASPVAAAVVGLQFKSKSARKRTGINDIRAGVTYSRIGGGNPPINSLETLQAMPERLDSLSERYFAADKAAFNKVIKEIRT